MKATPAQVSLPPNVYTAKCVPKASKKACSNRKLMETNLHKYASVLLSANFWSKYHSNPEITCSITRVAVNSGCVLSLHRILMLGIAKFYLGGKQGVFSVLTFRELHVFDVGILPLIRIDKTTTMMIGFYKSVGTAYFYTALCRHVA